MSILSQSVPESETPLEAEILARRALAVALNSCPGGRGQERAPLGAPDPRLVRSALDVLERRAQPAPAVTLAIEILERCLRKA